MDVESLERDISSYLCDITLLKQDSVFCLNCCTNSGNMVMVRDDRSNSTFDNCFYSRAARILSRRSIPMNTFTWFCSIKCLANMIYENQTYILEKITEQ